MRLAYFLAQAPYAPEEQFVPEEAAEIVRQGDEVMLLPMRPGSELTPGTPEIAASRSVPGRAWGPWTVRDAIGEVARRPRLLRTVGGVLLAHAPGEPVLAPLARNAFVVPRALSVIDLLRRWQPHHIHAHFLASTATAAMIVGRELGIDISLTAHSATDIEKRNLLVAKAEEARFIRVISEHGRDQLRERLPESLHDELTVLPMGIRRPRRPAVADGLSFETARMPSIVCIGRIVPEKGQRVVVAALAELAARGIAPTCHFVGDGPDRDEVAELARELGVAEQIRFHGYVPNDEVIGALAGGQAGALVLASETEGVPIVLMEAAACGVPLVASDVGAVAEIVQEGTGVLIPPRDPSATADGLAAVLSNPQQYTRGPDVVRTRYCLSRNVTRMRELFAAPVEGAPAA